VSKTSFAWMTNKDMSTHISQVKEARNRQVHSPHQSYWPPLE